MIFMQFSLLFFFLVSLEYNSFFSHALSFLFFFLFFIYQNPFELYNKKKALDLWCCLKNPPPLLGPKSNYMPLSMEMSWWWWLWEHHDRYDSTIFLWCGSTWSSDWKMAQLPMMILVVRRVRGWPKRWVLQPFCFLLVPHWWWPLHQSKSLLNIYIHTYAHIYQPKKAYSWPKSITFGLVRN